MGNSNAFINKTIIEPYSSGILDNLSFAVKDNIDVAGQITGHGSPAWAATHSKPVANAICLEQLLSVGGAYSGKTIADELAYSLIGINSFYKTPINPKAPDRVPGGSSSGSASAVAEQAVDFAVGTDTGGSIRVPAANCGIWGCRPSHGTVSVAGVLPLAPSFDTVGIVAQTGNILEKAMSVLLAQNIKTQKNMPTVCYINDIFEMSDKRILDAINKTLSSISKLTQVRSLALKDITDKHVNCGWLFELSAILLSTEVWNTYGSWVENEKPELSPGVAYSLRNYAKATYRKNLQQKLCAQKLFAEQLNKFLYEGNILCFPTTVDLAPKLTDITPEFLSNGDYIPRAMGVNAISGLSRTPQVTVPVAQVNEVPVGLSFLAGYGQDMMLINFCNELRANTTK